MEKCNNSFEISICEITNFTYLFAFLVLSFSTVITGIEAFKTTTLKYRIALTLETFISLVAGYVYYKYLFDSDTKDPLASCIFSPNNTSYRYVDWFITTPFLLLSLCVLVNPTNKNFPWNYFGLIVILNSIMIISGYLAETGKINQYIGWIIGTISLVAIFIIIYYIFEAGNQPIFWVFAIIWSLYGIVFYLPHQLKTVSYNILDVIAKAGFGIWTWLVSVELLTF